MPNQKYSLFNDIHFLVTCCYENISVGKNIRLLRGCGLPSYKKYVVLVCGKYMQLRLHRDYSSSRISIIDRRLRWLKLIILGGLLWLVQPWAHIFNNEYSRSIIFHIRFRWRREYTSVNALNILIQAITTLNLEENFCRSHIYLK